jgi:hypothetical protein
VDVVTSVNIEDEFLHLYTAIRDAIEQANDVLRLLPDAPADGHCTNCDGVEYEIIEDGITATGYQVWGDESGYQISSKHVEYSDGMLLPVMICSGCHAYYQHPRERGEWI